jgi:malonyl-CoA O-methyltransferase
MPSTVDKDLVRQRFRRCLPTYDDQATIQRRMAEQLVRRVVAECGTHCHRVFEIGSGTGILTRQLLRTMDIGALWTNDMVAECRGYTEVLAKEFPLVRVSFVDGDIEDAGGFPGELDLIVANAVFQWVQNLPRLLKTLTSLLAPGGVLAFCTFGPDNLAEVRDATGDALPYHDMESLRAMLPADMTLVAIEEDRVTLRFESPREVLEHLRLTGSNGLSRRSWTRKSLTDFDRRYRSLHPLNEGVGLTYHPIFLIARATPPTTAQTQSRQEPETNVFSVQDGLHPAEDEKRTSNTQHPTPNVQVQIALRWMLDVGGWLSGVESAGTRSLPEHRTLNTALPSSTSG